jgi:hypothetical protein
LLIAPYNCYRVIGYKDFNIWVEFSGSNGHLGYEGLQEPGNTTKRRKGGEAVRRAKVSILSGCNPNPATVAPVGSNRSGDGGNAFAEAFDAKDR